VSLYRQAAKRDANEGEIVRALLAAGARCWPLRSPCDQLVGYRGRFITLEIKDGSKPKSRRALTEAERVYRDTCEHAGLPHFVVESVDQALGVVLGHAPVGAR
jgi:hypothetical protein